MAVRDAMPFPVRGTPGGHRDVWDEDYVATMRRQMARQALLEQAIIPARHRDTTLLEAIVTSPASPPATPSSVVP
jgi:hypothetical protein